MRWTWDPDKAAANRVKHGLSFETAILVFDDPLHASKPDPHPNGDRWHTIGLVGPVLLLVIHTWPEESEEGEPVEVTASHWDRGEARRITAGPIVSEVAIELERPDCLDAVAAAERERPSAEHATGDEEGQGDDQELESPSAEEIPQRADATTSQ